MIKNNIQEREWYKKQMSIQNKSWTEIILIFKNLKFT